MVKLQNIFITMLFSLCCIGTVAGTPVVDFTVVDTTVSPGDTVQFTDASTVNGTGSYLWNFGDSGTSTDQNPIHSYTLPGTYTVTLNVTDNDGSGEEIKTDYITVGLPPNTGFLANTSNVINGEIIQFTYTPSDNPTFTEIRGWGNLWNLQWGEIEYETGIPPIYDAKYIESGNNHAFVIRSDGTIFAWGNNDSNQCNIPSGLVDVIDVKTYYDVSIALKSDGTIVGWGDDGYGILPTLINLQGVTKIAIGGVHALALLENGTVVSTGYNDDGQGNIPEEYIGHITDIACGEWHSALLLDNGTVLCVGYNGDGQCNTPSDLTNVIGIACGSYNTHALLENGSVISWGCNDNGQCNVPENLNNAISIGATEYTSAAVCSNGSIITWGWNDDGDGIWGIFDDIDKDAIQISLGKNGYILALLQYNPVSYRWDFGDGATSTEQNPTHTYSSPGNYDVTLTVTNNYGTSEQIKSDYVTVSYTGNVLPLADFDANETIIQRNGIIQFTDASAYFPTTWEWDFGDGTTSTEQNPTHQYNNVGRYDVTLTIRNIKGIDTTTKYNYISVTPNPVDFTADVVSGKSPLTVNFEITEVVSEGFTYRWYFGDDKSAVGPSVTHTYSVRDSQTFTVSLDVTYNGATVTTTKQNYIAVEEKSLLEFTNTQINDIQGLVSVSIIIILIAVIIGSVVSCIMRRD